MLFRSWTLTLLLALAALPRSGQSTGEPAEQPVKMHQTTEWNIRPSQAFDVLCLLNTLTVDSFYLGYYDSDYRKFAPKLTPEAKAALANLKRKVKDEKGQIISASLCLYFSATDDSTLDDLIATLAETSQMQNNLKKTPYYDDGGWALFESVRADLGVVFHFLKDIHFEDYWRDSILPIENAKIDSIKNDLPKYNVIAEVETLLGFPLSSNKITVYMLYYSQPHGIKITGTRFLTDVAWPFRIVVRNAAHEMMHPPFVLGTDPRLVAALNQLKTDDFLMDKAVHHNPAFGYNSLDGFMEEDCVQALEQLINEKLKIDREAHLRWKESDDGMHVFAVALYEVMKKERFNDKQETFQDFVIRYIRSGELGPGKIKPLYEAFYAPVLKGK